MPETIDLSAGLVPKTPPPAIDLSAGFVPKSATSTDFTSNPKGEGLYRMSKSAPGVWGDQPEIQVPYSKVQDAVSAGYRVHPDDEPKYNKDVEAEGKPVGFIEKAKTKVGETFNKLTATAPDVPIPEFDKDHPVSSTWVRLNNAAYNTEMMVPNAINRALRGVVGLKDLPQQAVETLDLIHKGDPQGMENLIDMTPPAIGKSLIENYQRETKDVGPVAALANLTGDVTALYAAGKIGAKVHGAVGDVADTVKQKLPEKVHATLQTVVGAGERQVKQHVTEEAEKANTARENTLEANRKADEATLEARGKVDEANQKQKLDDELALREAEEKTLKARGVVDETNKKAVEDHEAAVRKAEEETLKARGAVDDFNKAQRLKTKGAAVAAQKEANASEPYLEGDTVETSARQAHDETVKRQQDVEAKRTKLSADEAKARQTVTERIQAIYNAAREYFRKGFADVAAKLDAPDPKTGEAHTVSYADLDGMVDEAEGKIKGSRANVSIFEDIGRKAGGVGEKKRAKKTPTPSDLDPDELAMLGTYASDGSKLSGAKYSDLDGYYQEAGRIIGNPSTAPDVRQAVVKFRELLGKRMQKLAEEVDPEVAKKHKLLRSQYKEYAQGYRDYTGPSGSASPVAKGLKAVDAHNATTPYEGLAPEETRRVKRIIVGDVKDPNTQFTESEIIGPDGKPQPAWRFRKQTHAALKDLGNIQKGLAALPKPEKLAKDVETSAQKLADARAKAREAAAAKPETHTYPEPKPTPPAPPPKEYPEPEPTPPVTPPQEYAEPQATKPVDVPELDTRKIREQLMDEKLRQWTSVSKFQLARLVAGPIGIVVGMTTGHPFLELGASIYTGAELTPFALQKLLDRPGVREWFAKPPAGELETLQKVPHADRVRIADGFRGMMREADKQGKPLRVSPDVIAFIAASGSAPAVRKKNQ